MMETLVPVQFHRRGAQQVLSGVRDYDTTLIQALARAYYWRKLIDAGRVTGGADIARQEGLHRTSVNVLIRLTLLAPEITEAILNGRQPRTLTLQWLKKHRMPNDWDEQRQIIANFK